MTRVARTVEIKAPAQRVYDFLTLPSNLLGIWPNMRSVANVAPGPRGGHDFDWEYSMAGFRLKGHSTTEEARPGTLYRVRNEGGIPSMFVWTFEGLDGSGTRLTVDVEYEIPDAIVGKIAGKLVARMNERDLDTMLANLEDVMESGAGYVETGTVAHPH